MSFDIVTAPPSPTVLAARRRRKRYNERQDRCEKVYFVPLNHDKLERLIDAGELTEHDALDRQKVAEAITRLVDSLGSGGN